MGMIANQMLIETVCKVKQHFQNRSTRSRCAKKNSAVSGNRKERKG